MKQEEALREACRILQEVTGKTPSSAQERDGDHYREVHLGKKRYLTVDLFRADPDAGHIRVQLYGLREADYLHLERADGAATTQSEVRDTCTRCPLTPPMIPARYEGRKRRRYFGYQWHRGDEATPQDLARIERCVRWLYGNLLP